ncbi:MAG: hypothetical protein ACR2OE_14905 [Thermomicrobiales bacterium]
MNTFTRPAPKQARSPRKMATQERMRQISEQGNQLHDQLLDALDRGHATTSHHLIDRILKLYDERDVVMAAAQDNAGMKWSRAA